MRKPRDLDTELKALEDKARALKTRKVRQLGEPVIATGADTLTANELAGALIVLAETKENGKTDAMRLRLGSVIPPELIDRTGRSAAPCAGLPFA